MNEERELYNFLRNSGILVEARYKSFVVDYHTFTWPSMPKKERKRFDVGDIYLNACRCKLCGWFIRSKNRHDMVTCRCGKASIDGGSWYSKVSGNLENIELIRIMFDDYEAKDE
jgi:hypothetical protein